MYGNNSLLVTLYAFEVRGLFFAVVVGSDLSINTRTKHPHRGANEAIGLMMPKKHIGATETLFAPP